jgi:hypothetical protein
VVIGLIITLALFFLSDNRIKNAWFGGESSINDTNQTAKIQLNSGDTLESLDSPFECPEALTAAEGGGPEKVKLPNQGVSNTWMISFTAMFSQDQAKQLNNHRFIGLFYDSTTQRFSTRPIEEKIVHNGMFDSEDDQPVYHWPVKKLAHEGILFAFDNPMMKQNRNHIKSLLHTPTSIAPGQSIRFQAKEYNYRLGATDQVAEVTGANHHSDYTLTLRSQLKTGGKVNETLISYIPWFDDAEVTILFVGDLDADGYPDIIIDNPYKYTESGECGVLFLTSKSTIHGLAQPISFEVRGNKIETSEGQFIFYGC